MLMCPREVPDLPFARVMYITASSGVQLKTMPARLLRPILTSARYGRVTGQGANTAFHSSVIAANDQYQGGEHRNRFVCLFLHLSFSCNLSGALFIDYTDWLQLAS